MMLMRVALMVMGDDSNGSRGDNGFPDVGSLVLVVADDGAAGAR